jgi:hypothetical protein
MVTSALDFQVPISRLSASLELVVEHPMAKASKAMHSATSPRFPCMAIKPGRIRANQPRIFGSISRSTFILGAGCPLTGRQSISQSIRSCANGESERGRILTVPPECARHWGTAGRLRPTAPGNFRSLSLLPACSARRRAHSGQAAAFGGTAEIRAGQRWRGR